MRQARSLSAKLLGYESFEAAHQTQRGRVEHKLDELLRQAYKKGRARKVKADAADDFCSRLKPNALFDKPRKRGFHG